jgi:hypothetical protein
MVRASSYAQAVTLAGPHLSPAGGMQKEGSGFALPPAATLLTNLPSFFSFFVGGETEVERWQVFTQSWSRQGQSQV